jgi:hypothetical protein
MAQFFCRTLSHTYPQPGLRRPRNDCAEEQCTGNVSGHAEFNAREQPWEIYMYHPFIPGLAAVALLLGDPAQAQDAPKQVPQQPDGRSLASPDDQRQADDAQHTTGGRAGRDEPGSHAPTRSESGPREPVLKDGKLNVPGAPTQSETTPSGSMAR